MKNKKPEKTEQEAQVENQDAAIAAESRGLAECRDQLLRVTADFQNFKKRVEKERVDWSIVSQSVVLRLFLPLIDDIELAMASAEASELSEADREWLEGFRLIQKKFGKILEEQGVEEIDCHGSFDPNIHEALVSIDSDLHKSGEIVEVLRKGYSLKGTVLRHSRVSVSK